MANWICMYEYVSYLTIIFNVIKSEMKSESEPHYIIQLQFNIYQLCQGFCFLKIPWWRCQKLYLNPHSENEMFLIWNLQNNRGK